MAAKKRNRDQNTRREVGSLCPDGRLRRFSGRTAISARNIRGNLCKNCVTGRRNCVSECGVNEVGVKGSSKLPARLVQVFGGRPSGVVVERMQIRQTLEGGYFKQGESLAFVF
jgi:hypothetical protein